MHTGAGKRGVCNLAMSECNALLEQAAVVQLAGLR